MPLCVVFERPLPTEKSDWQEISLPVAGSPSIILSDSAFWKFLPWVDNGSGPERWLELLSCFQWQGQLPPGGIVAPIWHLKPSGVLLNFWACCSSSSRLYKAYHSPHPHPQPVAFQEIFLPKSSRISFQAWPGSPEWITLPYTHRIY